MNDLWVWENQVDAMGAYLEKRIVEEAMPASGSAATSGEHSASSEEQVPELRFVAVDSNDVVTSSPEESNTTLYDLATLLSS